MSSINIVGRGVNPSIHLSISAIDVLKKADKIIGIEPEEAFWDELSKTHGICKVENIGDLYNPLDKDMTNYNRFIEYILELSSSFNNLALLVAGHPMLGVTFIDLLEKSIPSTTEINIIDGISSFNTMTTFLKLDPLEQGTTLLDANRLLLFQYVMEPALAYFIYHVCSVGNAQTNFLNPEEKNRVDLLKNYLLKYYPEDKELFLCRIANGKNENSIKIPATISSLSASQIDFSTTLYLPAEKPSKFDRNFYNLLIQP